MVRATARQPVNLHMDKVSNTKKLKSGVMCDIDVIDQKRVRVFYQGFQTPRKRWKQDAEGAVLLLFRGVWKP